MLILERFADGPGPLPARQPMTPKERIEDGKATFENLLSRPAIGREMTAGELMHEAVKQVAKEHGLKELPKPPTWEEILPELKAMEQEFRRQELQKLAEVGQLMAERQAQKKADGRAVFIATCRHIRDFALIIVGFVLFFIALHAVLPS